MAESVIPTRVLAAVHSVLPLVVVFYAFILHAWWPIWSYIVAAIFIQLLLTAVLPLHAIEPAAARRSYRLHALSMFGLVAVVLVSAFLSGHSK